MTDTAPEPGPQDERILAAAQELVEEAVKLEGLDPTPILTDARWRRLLVQLRELDVLTDEQTVEIEVGAIEETTEQLRRVRADVEARARVATLLAPLDTPNGRH